ncbi:hypothetical protein JTB14_005310 [Gonioctena quinquepunctata]|nr:hypothetical protein JTB14_005310 [Gonioctena quinquepunctata]
METLTPLPSTTTSTNPNSVFRVPLLPLFPDPTQETPKPTKIVGQNPRDRSEAISESEKRKKAASSSEDELSLSTHDDSSTSQGKITKKKGWPKGKPRTGAV